MWENKDVGRISQEGLSAISMNVKKNIRIDSATTLFIQLATSELLKEAEKNGIVRFDDYNMYAITIDIHN